MICCTDLTSQVSLTLHGNCFQDLLESVSRNRQKNTAEIYHTQGNIALGNYFLIHGCLYRKYHCKREVLSINIELAVCHATRNEQMFVNKIKPPKHLHRFHDQSTVLMKDVSKKILNALLDTHNNEYVACNYKN